jgi:nucleoid-associated protein YejK
MTTEPTITHNPMHTTEPLALRLSEGLGPAVPERENAEERYCYQMLAELRKSYERDAKPYIDRLVAIKSTQAPSITLTLEQAREFVDFTMSARDGA